MSFLQGGQVDPVALEHIDRAPRAAGEPTLKPLPGLASFARVRFTVSLVGVALFEAYSGRAASVTMCFVNYCKYWIF
jgi:hypothetical protein